MVVFSMRVVSVAYGLFYHILFDSILLYSSFLTGRQLDVDCQQILWERVIRHNASLVLCFFLIFLIAIRYLLTAEVIETTSFSSRNKLVMQGLVQNAVLVKRELHYMGV
jgi:hypothetical protein